MSENTLYSKNYKDDFDFNYALSLSDLLLVDGFNLKDVAVIEKILYENGMDVSQGWNTDSCEHRNLQNKRVNTLRFQGVQRMDREWLATGAVQVEDIIDACRDPDMRSDMMLMNSFAKNVDRVKKIK